MQFTTKHVYTRGKIHVYVSVEVSHLNVDKVIISENYPQLAQKIWGEVGGRGT